MVRHPTLPLLLAGLLAACANIPGPTPATGGPLVPGAVAPRQVGYLHLSAARPPGSSGVTVIRGRGLFFGLPGLAEPPPTGQAPDTCTVVPGTDRVSWVPTPQLPSPAPALLAGETLPVTGPGGPFLTLIRLPGDPAYFSSSVFTLTGLPGGLSVRVPGAPGGFPAVGPVPLPAAPPPLALTSPTSGEVRVGTTLTWASPRGEAPVYLWGAGTGNRVFFFCTARDDGSFAFPETTRAALRQLGFTAGRLNEIGRVNTTAVRQGDATLFVNLYTLITFQ